MTLCPLGLADAYEPGTLELPPGAPCDCEACPEEEPAIPVSDESGVSLYGFSGEFYESVVDLRIPGRGIDFTWSRKYRSQLGPDTAMGAGWDFSYNVYIEQAGPDILLHDGNTREDLYLLQPDATWTADQFFRVLEQNPDGSYTLTFSDTGKWNFHGFDASPQEGKLVEIVDRNQNTIGIEYDGLGRPFKIHDTLDTPGHNRDITIAYNPDGFIDSVTDFAGRQVSYTYYQNGDPGGSLGDLKSVTTPAVVGTPNGNDFPGGKTTVYTYSTGFADPRLNHNLLTITDPKGQLHLTNVYAVTQNPGDLEFDRVVRQLWGDQNPVTGDIIDIAYVPVAPDPGNNFAVVRTIVNDRVGNVSEYFYDAGNRRVIRREYTGRADPDQPTTDVANRPAGQLRPSDPAFFETRTEYNSDALPTRIVHPNLDELLLTYDQPNPDRRAQGNLRERKRLPGPLGGDQAEIVELFEYDDGFGGCCGTNFVIRHADGRGNDTVHQYDANGNRLHTEHRIPSIVEDFEYNAFGQMTAHTGPDNGSGHRRRDEFTYFAAGSQLGYRQSAIVDAPGLALTTTYEYDLVGNVTRITDPRGHDTTRTVNALNQIVRRTSREVTNGSGVRYQRDFFYDDNDNLVRIDVQNRDESGLLQPNTDFTTTYEYDILNYRTRVIQEIDVGHDIVTEVQYDANRNPTLLRRGEATNGNQPDNVVRFLYDERDLVFQRIRAEGNADQSTDQRDYDGNRNLIRLHEGLEETVHVTTYVYDGFDRRTLVTDPMGNVTSMHYDPNDNRVSRRVDGEIVDVPGSGGNDRLLEVTYVYDNMDRLIRTETEFFDTDTQNDIDDGKSVDQLVFSDNSQILRIINDNAHELVVTYDTANRIADITDAKGNSTAYTYDPNDNVLTETDTEKSDLGNADEVFVTTYAYDNLDRRIRTIDNVGNTSESGYDSRNNEVVIIDPLDNVVRYAYDGIDRKTLTTRFLTDDGTGAGNPAGTIVTGQTWDDSSRLTARTDDAGNTTTSVYDALDRVIAEQYADGTQRSYTYDVHDNRRSVTDANGSVWTCTYDLLDRVTNRTIAPGAGVSNDTTFEDYDYDGLNRLVGAEDDDSVVTWSYNSLSNIVRETLNGQTTTRAHDGVGNSLTCTYPGGRTITCTYDALDRKSTIADGGGTIATFAFIGPGRIERVEYGNGTRADYAYDGILPNPADDFGERQIVETLHSIVSGSATIDRRIYTWTPELHKSRRIEIEPSEPELETTYAYDSIYRLTRTITSFVDDPAPAIRDTEHTLDGVGNWEDETTNGELDPYLLDPSLPEPADQQMNQYTVTPRDTRRYDANGNLSELGVLPADFDRDGRVGPLDVDTFQSCATGPNIAMTDQNCLDADLDRDGDGDQVDFGLLQLCIVGPDELSDVGCAGLHQSVVYDYRDRMVEYVDHESGLRHTYSYDSLGRRIARITDADGAAEETRYFYDETDVVEEQDAGSTTTATYVHGVRYIPDNVVSAQRSGVDYYYHGDDLYNVMALTDGSAGVVERYDYGDYGEPTVYALGQGPDLTAVFDSDPNAGPTNISQRIAESFTLNDQVRMIGLRWWGGYSYDAGFPAQDHFLLQIYTDNAGLPGTLLHDRVVGNDVLRVETGQTVNPGDPQPEFLYLHRLETPIVLPPGTYWLHVQNDTTGHPTIWGWESAGNGDGQVAFSHNGGPWTIAPNADVAYDLMTDRSALGNPYLFSGRRFDPETGWYYYRTRYLDPRAGRFTTRDTIGLWGDELALGNAFTYAANDPWTRRDPSGTFCDDLCEPEGAIQNCRVSGTAKVPIGWTQEELDDLKFGLGIGAEILKKTKGRPGIKHYGKLLAEALNKAVDIGTKLSTDNHGFELVLQVDYDYCTYETCCVFWERLDWYPLSEQHHCSVKFNAIDAHAARYAPTLRSFQKKMKKCIKEALKQVCD